MAYDEDYDVPGSIVRFDTTMTAQGEFVNVRDMQQFCLNHNYILAKGCRRTLFTWATPQAGIVYDYDSASLISSGPDTHLNRCSVYEIQSLRAKPLFEIDCLVSANAMMVTCVVAAGVSGWGGGGAAPTTPDLYFKVSDPTTQRPSAGYALTTAYYSAGGGIRSTGSASAFRVFIPRPLSGTKLIDGKRLLRIALIQGSGLSTSTLTGYTTGFTLSNVSDRSITTTTGDDYNITTITYSGALVCTSDDDVEPRMIIGGGVNTMKLDKPMSRPIKIGVDTFSIYAVYGRSMYAATCYEEPITDWNLKRPPTLF